MIRALHTSATGMAAQETNVNTISNNIANANTNAFKKSRAEFNDLLYETIQEAGDRSSNDSEYSVGLQIGSGAKTSAVRKNFEQGSVQVTNNPYDLMIQGEGFFGIISADDQVHYTRDGSFGVDSQGNLVTKSGQKVFPGINIPPNTTHLNITANGKVEAYTKGTVEPTQLGEIPIFTFTNPTGLKSLGGNLYGATAGSGFPTQMEAGREIAGTIEQGMLESSNVSVMNEMTDLIKAQRAYEMNSKVMGVADQMMQTVNGLK